MKTTTQDVKPKRKRSNHKIDGVVGYDIGRSMSEARAPSRASGGGDDGGRAFHVVRSFQKEWLWPLRKL